MGLFIISSDAASNKHDLLLTELFRQEKWKQALAHCDKRQKKGEKGEFLLFIKAAVQIQHPETSRQVQGQKELIGLLSRDPPITDAQLLGTIEDFAESIEFHNTHVQSIWDRAVAHQPRDEALLEEWFRRKFDRKDYKVAMKAANLYQKNFPQTRQPYYWAILAGYLASISPKGSPNERQFFGQIACKFLAKSAADARTACSSLADTKSSRALRGPNDLLLLLTVYRSQAMYKDALEILDDSHIGLCSSVCGKSWELVKEKVELYQFSKSFDLLWEFCYDLLQDAHPDNLEDSSRIPRIGFGSFGDDCMIWEELVNAAYEMGNDGRKFLTVQIIESYLVDGKRVQNAFQALLHYYSLEHPSVQISQVPFRAALDRCYEHYGSQPVCFDTLQPYVHLLHPSLQLEFLDYCAGHAVCLQQGLSDCEALRSEWLTSEINSLTLDYYLVVSRINDHPGTALINAFIKSCNRLYKLSLLINLDFPSTDRRSGDDAAIMAATACIYLYHRNHDCKALIRSALILEMLSMDSKHNYSAILLLVQLYIFLGCMSLAVEHWRKLEVKNVQDVSTAWILFQRISTLSPGQITVAGGTFDPQEEVWEKLTAMDRVARVMAQTTDQYFQGGNYSGFVSLTQTMDQMAISTARYIFFHEAARLDRFRNTGFCLTKDIEAPRGVDEPAEMRDGKGFPDRESHGQPRIQEYIQPGPLPRINWIHLHLQLQALHNVLEGTFDIADVVNAPLYDQICLREMTDLTEEERDLGNLMKLLTNIVANATANKLRSLDMDCFASIERWIDVAEARLANSTLLPISRGLHAPHWKYYHWTYMTLDGLRLMRLTFEEAELLCAPKDRSTISWFQEIRNKIDKKRADFLDGLQRAVTKLRIPLDQRESVRDLLKAGVGCGPDLDDSLGQGLRRANQDLMEVLAARMLASWRIGLDNVRDLFDKEVQIERVL